MILVVSAVPSELAGLAPHGLQQGSTTIGRETVTGAAVGVGPLAAAASTARVIQTTTPAAVVFVGTAGVFVEARARFPRGTAAVAQETTLLDLAMVRGLAERPPALTDRFAMDAAWSARLAASHSATDSRARVASTSAITVDDALAHELAEAGFDLENLELAGVAAACAAAGVPCAAVLGVSNVVGSNGRTEWRSHRDVAERAACALVLSALGA